MMKSQLLSLPPLNLQKGGLKLVVKRENSLQKRNGTAQSKGQQTTEPSTKKSPRIRAGGQTDVQTAQHSGKRKRTANVQPEAQIEEEPTPMPKFIDDDARDRFKWISQKGFITQWTIVSHEFRKLDLVPVLKLFEFKKWTHILTIPNSYYPDTLHQFFANLRKGRSHTDLVSRENFVDIELNPDIVSTILKIKIEDGFKEKIANFFSYEEFPSTSIIFML